MFFLGGAEQANNPATCQSHFTSYKSERVAALGAALGHDIFLTKPSGRGGIFGFVIPFFRFNHA
jgi:hypothetical protein